jgi:hypothetical protein
LTDGGFHSFHWQGCTLDDPALSRALDELMNPSGAYLQAFTTLLQSGNTVAEGIALDHFQYSGSLRRFGSTSVLEGCEQDALAVARKLLREPPSTGESFEGANHASALNAMMNLAQPEDADLIADALALTVNVDVRSAGCRAAGAALWSSEQPSPRLLDALAAIAFDDELYIDDRTEAVSAIGDADCPEATALLIRATESTKLELQTHAANELTKRGRLSAHRVMLQRLAATWPEDPGYHGREVRKAVTGFHSLHWVGVEPADADLREAHELLMFPSDDKRAYHDAFLTLLRSDDPVAVGIALDHFRSPDGVSEVLDSDVIDEEEIIHRAREVLRQPPTPPELSPHEGAAANHLSAVDLLGNEAADAELVTNLLATTESDKVREMALWAAGTLLRTETPYPSLLDQVSRLAFTPPHQCTAIRVLSGAAGPAADPILIRALDSNDPAIRLEAAWQLAQPDRIARHRDLLTTTVDSLPTEDGRSRLLVTEIRKRALGE